MLNIYPVILDFVSDIAALIPRIAHHDPDLARQLHRSSTSVVLNVARGMSALGRSKTGLQRRAPRDARKSRRPRCLPAARLRAGSRHGARGSDAADPRHALSAL